MILITLLRAVQLELKLKVLISNAQVSMPTYVDKHLNIQFLNCTRMSKQELSPPPASTPSYVITALISEIQVFGSMPVIASCSTTNNGSHDITLSGKIGVKVNSLISKAREHAYIDEHLNIHIPEFY